MRSSLWLGVALVALCGASMLASVGHAAAPTYFCHGSITKLFDNSTSARVANGATPAAFSTRGNAFCVTSFQTYHWNDGKGAKPGSLSLTRVSGPSGFAAKLGPFPATGAAGQNGAPNVNWMVTLSTAPSPQAVIDGSYMCDDSNHATWSTATAGGEGICIVYGLAASPNEAPAPTTTAAATTTVAHRAPSQWEAVHAKLARNVHKVEKIADALKAGTISPAELRRRLRDLPSGSAVVDGVTVGDWAGTGKVLGDYVAVDDHLRAAEAPATKILRTHSDSIKAAERAKLRALLSEAKDIAGNAAEDLDGGSVPAQVHEDAAKLTTHIEAIENDVDNESGDDARLIQISRAILRKLDLLRTFPRIAYPRGALGLVEDLSFGDTEIAAAIDASEGGKPTAEVEDSLEHYISSSTLVLVHLPS